MTEAGFSADQERMLATLLDVVVPASDDGRFPGAGELDLGAHVARLLAQTPMLRPVLEYGLSTLAELAGARHPGGWDALSGAERTSVLEEFARSDQFFLPAVLLLAYSGYYQQPRVLEALGLEARPPHPEGYAMGEDDLALLDRVRARARMWRE